MGAVSTEDHCPYVFFAFLLISNRFYTGSTDPPVPPPVRFAPLGPMGLDVSWNLHESEVQTQVPLMGSQKGVEQLAGTG